MKLILGALPCVCLLQYLDVGGKEKKGKKAAQTTTFQW